MNWVFPRRPRFGTGSRSTETNCPTRISRNQKSERRSIQKHSPPIPKDQQGFYDRELISRRVKFCEKQRVRKYIKRFRKSYPINGRDMDIPHFMNILSNETIIFFYATMPQKFPK